MDRNRNFLLDISSVTKSAFSGAMNMKRDLCAFITSYIEQMIKGMHFVKKEEFSALKRQVSMLKERLDKIAPESASTSSNKKSKDKMSNHNKSETKMDNQATEAEKKSDKSK